MDRISYSMYPLWRPFVFIVLGILAVAGGLALLGPAGSQRGPGPLFTVAWFVILLWNAYWFLFRGSYRIEVEGDRVRWFTPLRRGEFPLDELVSIGSPIAFYQIAIFKRTSGPSVIMMVQRGLSEFAAEVQQRAPQVTIKTGTYEKLLLRSGRNAFQRDK